MGCGEAVSSPDPVEPVEVFAALEFPMGFSIALPEDAAPKGPVHIQLFTETGTEPLAEHTTTTEGRNTTVRWQPDVPLPERLRIEAVVFDQADGKRGDADYTATTVEKRGSLAVLLMLPRVAKVTATLENRMAAPARPVYANTKGSHHYQDTPVLEPAEPKPDLRIRATRTRPAHAFGVLEVQVTDPANPDFQLHTFQSVQRFPADIELFLPAGTSLPKGARVLLKIESNKGVEQVEALAKPEMTLALEPT